MTVVLAYGKLNDPIVFDTLLFAAGVALFYSTQLPVRVAGVILSVAALLRIADYPQDPDNWGIAAVDLALAAICVFFLRPKWLRTGGERPKDA